jgi:hypothetical protein
MMGLFGSTKKHKKIPGRQELPGILVAAVGIEPTTQGVEYVIVA